MSLCLIVYKVVFHEKEMHAIALVLLKPILRIAVRYCIFNQLRTITVRRPVTKISPTNSERNTDVESET